MAKATMGCYEDPPWHLHRDKCSRQSWDPAGGLPLTTSLPFTLKSTGKENSNKNEVKGSVFETVRHLKSGRIGGITPLHMDGWMAMCLHKVNQCPSPWVNTSGNLSASSSPAIVDYVRWSGVGINPNNPRNLASFVSVCFVQWKNKRLHTLRDLAVSS